jgi:hypothetical protein
MKYRIFFGMICSVLFLMKGTAQTLGGNAVFSFITLPNTAQISALGGVNISTIGNDVGLAFHNPSLLRKSMHGQINSSFNNFFSGIRNINTTAAFYIPKVDLIIGGGIQYLNYGNITQTDAAGNILGNIKPVDYAVQLMAAKQYKERFWLGVTAKYIHSNYGIFRAAGIAVDIGLLYADTAHFFQASVLIKNLGTQLSTYAPSQQKEELPFDIQAGVSKRLEYAPLQFSLTAHNLHRFNIFYSDTTFNAAEGDLRSTTTLQKMVVHLILSAQIYLSEKVELSVGYNFLRRQDLNIFNASSGLNGVTAGVGFLHKKIHIRYATGFYQQNLFHQFALNFNIKGAAF